MADERPRKGDVTPDSQREAYEARGGEVTSVGDEIDQAYEDGRKAGAKDTPAPSTATTAPASPGRPRLSSSGKLAIGAPLAVETILISVNAITEDHHPPYPSQLLVAFAFFGLLGLASGDAAGPAAALGWGIVTATFLAGTKSVGPPGQNIPGTQSPAAIGVITKLGNFFGGKYAPKGSSTTGPSTSKVSTTAEAGSTALP